LLHGVLLKLSESGSECRLNKCSSRNRTKPGPIAKDPGIIFCDFLFTVFLTFAEGRLQTLYILGRPRGGLCQLFPSWLMTNLSSVGSSLDCMSLMLTR